MDVSRIQSYANRIAENEIALKWLREYGGGLTGRDYAGLASVRLNHAGGCPGAKEAERILSSYAKLALPDLVDKAIASCINSIAMDRDAIRQELDREPVE